MNSLLIKKIHIFAAGSFLLLVTGPQHLGALWGDTDGTGLVAPALEEKEGASVLSQRFWGITVLQEGQTAPSI